MSGLDLETELLQYAPVALLEVSLNGIIRSHNAVLPCWFGESELPQENMLVGRNLVEWFSRSGKLHYESILIPKLLLNEQVREMVIEINSLTAGAYSVMLNANLVVDQETGSRRIFLALMHATERIRFEQGLISAQRIAQLAEERLNILQHATSQLAVAEGLNDLGQVLSGASALATQAAWNCVVLTGATGAAAAGAPLHQATLMQWGTTPGFSFHTLDFVRHNEIAVCCSPEEIRAGFPLHGEEIVSRGVESLIVTPILRPGKDGREEELLGAICNWFRRGRTLQSEVTDTLSALAVQAERVIEHLTLQDQLRHRALNDGLTGLANRVFLEERLEQIISSSQRNGTACAVVFLDLDGFKAINDRLGHGVGDEVLREVALRLKKCCRPSDTICRLGGDEFVVAAENIDSESATQLGQRILQSIHAPLTDIAPGFPLSASIGVLKWHPLLDAEAPTAVAMVAASDTLMYASKRSGKNAISLRDWYEVETYSVAGD